MGSFGYAWIQWGGPRGRRVPRGSRGFTSALIGFASLVRARMPRDSRVDPGLRGFTQTRRGIIWFIRVRASSLARALGLSDSFSVAWIHSAATWDRPVNVRICSQRLAQESSVSFEFAWVHLGAPSCCRDHSGSRGFNQARPRVVGFICIRVVSFGQT